MNGRNIASDATVQTCVVYLVRNSLRYASKKYWGQITRELQEIYTVWVPETRSGVR
jgi:transposase-like protein